MNDRAAHATTGGKPGEQPLTTYWGRFGSLVHDYLGIPYKYKGRAIGTKTGKPTGVATDKVGLVCTSFVDVVLSRHLHDDPEKQLPTYDFGENGDIFDQYGLTQITTRIEPAVLPDMPLSRERVFGVVFHMQNAWVKHVKANEEKNIPEHDEPKPPGSRIHVGFLAFHEGKLFLIHASGRKGPYKGVHIRPWTNFLEKMGSDLGKFGAGDGLGGPKFLSVYNTEPTQETARRGARRRRVH